MHHIILRYTFRKPSTGCYRKYYRMFYMSSSISLRVTLRNPLTKFKCLLVHFLALLFVLRTDIIVTFKRKNLEDPPTSMLPSPPLPWWQQKIMSSCSFSSFSFIICSHDGHYFITFKRKNLEDPPKMMLPSLPLPWWQQKIMVTPSPSLMLMFGDMPSYIPWRTT